jgi:hypothetical protein
MKWWEVGVRQRSSLRAQAQIRLPARQGAPADAHLRSYPFVGKDVFRDQLRGFFSFLVSFCAIPNRSGFSTNEAQKFLREQTNFRSRGSGAAATFVYFSPLACVRSHFTAFLGARVVWILQDATACLRLPVSVEANSGSHSLNFWTSLGQS